jgi:hypothetical protein
MSRTSADVFEAASQSHRPGDSASVITQRHSSLLIYRAHCTGRYSRSKNRLQAVAGVCPTVGSQLPAIAIAYHTC